MPACIIFLTNSLDMNEVPRTYTTVSMYGIHSRERVGGWGWG